MEDRSGQLEPGTTIRYCGPLWPSGNHRPVRSVINSEWEDV
jgi:hypothetical protein